MKNKLFIDCGAHCGESILEAKKRYGDDVKIISFESNPNLAIPLQKYFKDDPVDAKCPYCEESGKPCSYVSSLARAWARGACKKKHQKTETGD